MSASADQSQQSCPNCGALLECGKHFAGHCLACLLDPMWEEEEAPAAGAERFGHYRVAIHTDSTPLELGRGTMGVTYKAFDVDQLLNTIALRSSYLAGPFTDRAVGALRLLKNFLMPLLPGLAIRIHGSEQHGRRAKDWRNSSGIGQPCFFWMGWSPFSGADPVG
jgi:hypothetical protein